MTSLRSGSATDVGRRRQTNQDTVLEAEDIFAVADGMGGHQGGEVASLAAVEALRDAFAGQPTLAGFELAIRRANEAVEEQARASAELRNMGTTLTAVALTSDGEGDLLAVANVGDSRAYLMRDGDLTQLTEDHSVPQELLRQGQLTEDEAAADPRRNILTRVLGASFGAGPDVQNIVPFKGDRLLLCSDGLYNEVPDDEIAAVLAAEGDPGAAAQRLVDMANGNGGADNISVVIIDVVDDGGRAASASASLSGEEGAARPPQGAAAGGREGGGRPRPGGGARSSTLMTAGERDAELRRLGEGGTGGAAAAWGAGGGSGGTAVEPPAVHEAPERRVTARVVAFLVLTLLILGGAAGAVAFYARGSYFVGLDGDEVAIFKGRPGGLLWFEPTLEQPTGLLASQVPAARAEDVRAGYEVTTLGEAARYVDNLRAQALDPGGAGADTTLPPASTTPSTLSPGGPGTAPTTVAPRVTPP